MEMFTNEPKYMKFDKICEDISTKMLKKCKINDILLKMFLDYIHLLDF